ncbi:MULTISPECIES: M15 family metallopeptidase [Synechococcales]|uniref:M15 family metallopeptidase n=1 Tax=Synechococcus sp. CS-1324 TaxID=2847980 RepID=UPI00223A850B|nr:M15 family metallopeptidase [Synechococcus sp. CS-1324]
MTPRARSKLPTRELPHEIPVARRTARPIPAASGPLKPLVLGAAGLAALGFLLVVIVPLARTILDPDPLAGFGSQRSFDGRLLGHFPFPEVSADQLIQVAPGLKAHRDAAEPLLAMQREAAADGVDLRVLSGFRDLALQKQLFFDVKAERNQSAAERAKVSAPPGFSEHSTGLAFDLGDGTRPGTNLKDAFETTPAFAWLERHANRHHFRLSFPKGNRQGVSYEPWHWRFEGSAEALKLFEAARRGAEIR